mgnify:CR=1 FL=1
MLFRSLQRINARIETILVVLLEALAVVADVQPVCMGTAVAEVIAQAGVDVGVGRLSWDYDDASL